MASEEKFHVVFVKPTHYDDDGYPLQWRRSTIPANSLACLNGIAADCVARKVLGDVDVVIHTIDETNTRIKPKTIIEMIRADGGKGMLALVGVQSNQFPRAIDVARPFLAAVTRYPAESGGRYPLPSAKKRALPVTQLPCSRALLYVRGTVTCGCRPVNSDGVLLQPAPSWVSRTGLAPRSSNKVGDGGSASLLQGRQRPSRR